MKFKLLKTFYFIASLGIAMLSCVVSANAQEITAINFNGDIIGKVIPDGKVVGFENQLIGNITADSLIVDFKGKLIGGVVPQGIVIGNDARLLGKVGNDGAVRLPSGQIIGKTLPNGLVVNDTFDIIGGVVFPGIVYGDNGSVVDGKAELTFAKSSYKKDYYVAAYSVENNVVSSICATPLNIHLFD